MARKLKDATAADAQPATVVHNVTDDVIRKHIGICNRLKDALDKANGEYRAALKAAKDDGIDPSDITWYLKTKKRDLEEVDRETMRRTRIAKLMQLPLGTQLGMFNGQPLAEVIAQEVEQTGKRDDIDPAFRAYLDGKDAGKKGIDRAQNPHPVGSAEFKQWTRGWIAGQGEIAEQLAKNDRAKKRTRRAAKKAAEEVVALQ